MINEEENFFEDEITSRVNELTISLNKLQGIDKITYRITTERQFQKIQKFHKKERRKIRKDKEGTTRRLDKNPEVKATDEIIQQIKKAKQDIIEHAARRVELYFYLLIYYYKTGYRIENEQTAWQYGKGENSEGKKFTQACHSSLFSSPVGITYCTDLHQRTRRVKIKLGNNNHFFKNLNATVILPIAVNNFDSLMEGKIEAPSDWREEALNIINLVSQKAYTPIQGLVCFFYVMEDFFAKVPLKSKEAKEIHKYEKEGTFSQKWILEQKLLIIDYVHSLLMPIDEKSIKENPKGADKMYEEKYEEIRKQMINPDNNNEKNNLANPNKAMLPVVQVRPDPVKLDQVNQRDDLQMAIDNHEFGTCWEWEGIYTWYNYFHDKVYEEEQPSKTIELYENKYGKSSFSVDWCIAYNGYKANLKSEGNYPTDEIMLFLMSKIKSFIEEIKRQRAATNIQKVFRGFLSRQKQPINQLIEEQKAKIREKVNQFMKEEKYSEAIELITAIQHQHLHKAMQIVRDIPEKEMLSKSGLKLKY